MKFVIIGDVGSAIDFHVGDEAMLNALIDAISWRFTNDPPQWTIVSPDGFGPDDHRANRMIPGFGFLADTDDGQRMARLEQIQVHSRNCADHISADSGSDATNALISHVADADAVFISGGGNLHSRWPHHIFERVALARTAHDQGVPIFIVGQSIGPDLQPSHEELVSELLQIATLVGVREARSKNLAERLVDHRVPIYLAIDESTFVAEGTEEPQLPSLGAYLALTLDPHSVVGRPYLLNLLAQEVCTFAVQHSLAVVVIPHLGSIGSQPPSPDSDIGVCNQIANRILLRRPDLDVRVLDVSEPETARAWSANARITLSSRFHPIVFALSGGAPAIFLFQDDYTRMKGEGHLRLFGLEVCAISIDRISRGRLLKLLESTLQQADPTELFRTHETLADNRRQIHDRIISLLSPTRSLSAD